MTTGSSPRWLTGGIYRPRSGATTSAGYQVIHKWLSYREQPLLGRPLTPDEVEEVTHMARRLAAIVLMEPALNANYQDSKASLHPWPGLEE